MKILRMVVITVVFAIVAGVTVLSGNPIWQTVAVIAASVVGTAVSILYECIDTHGQGLVTWFKSKIVYSKKDIYLSFSYLYRIEIEGKYLLVRGNRLKDRYQPVGGVYKYYPEAHDYLIDTINATPDTQFTNNKESDDLRLRIKGKNLLVFYDWFKTMKNREYDPRREFYEELIMSGLLPEEKFRDIRYRKVSVHNKGITKSAVPNRIPEVIYADIFDVKLDEEQKKLIKEAVSKHPYELCLATPEEIENRKHGNVAEMNVGNNAQWIFGE